MRYVMVTLLALANDIAATNRLSNLELVKAARFRGHMDATFWSSDFVGSADLFRSIVS